jgi:metallo-beta-lactamase class B
VNIVYADSVTAVSAPGYRFSDHPKYVAAFRKSLARIGKLPCDLLITPHPGASNFIERLEGKTPLIAPGQCPAYAAEGRRKLDERLAQETVAK